MRLYVHKGGQQLGPFDESEVARRLQVGEFSGEDLGIREGETQWMPLNILFPQAQAADVPLPPPPVSAAAAAPNVVAEPVQYRKTLIPKIFFGLTLLGSVALTIGALAYWKFGLGPSGDLDTDFGNIAFRDLALYTAAASFGMSALAFLAFLLCFKRKIIRSSGLRIALRIFFVLAILIGVVNLGYAAISYLNWSPRMSTTAKPGAPGNDMLKALEDGEKAAGPLTQLGIFGPIGVGFLLFGLSGFSMTKSSGVLE